MLILEIKIAWVTPKNDFSNGHTPKILRDSGGQDPQKSRIQHMRRQKDVCFRTTAHEIVPFNDDGLSTDLSDKEDSSAQDVALQVAYRPAGLLWLIVYFGKCRICGFGVQAKLDQL